MRHFVGVDHHANIKRQFKAGTVGTEALIAHDHKHDRAAWFLYQKDLDSTEFEEDWEAHRAGPGPADTERDLFLHQLLTHTAHLIERLPPRQAQAMALAMEGASQHEIGCEMACSAQAARLLVCKGRTKLLAWLDTERRGDLQDVLCR